MTDTITGTTAAIERELDLAASPDRVWRALTDSAEVAQWFPQRADIPDEVGRIGWMEWDGHPRYHVRLEAREPQHYVAWRWGSSADEDFETSSNLVEWTLEPTARGGTRLHLRETGFQSPDARRGNVEGWLDELSELVEFLADADWQHGIRRTWTFRSSPERVWQAFGDASEFGAWWGGTEPIEMRPGFEGWFAWPVEGRYAMRIERVEPPIYLSWRWTTKPGVPYDEADEILLTEWALMPGEDSGTVVHLLETGFVGPDNHRLNTKGWDTDIEPILRRHFGEG